MLYLIFWKEECYSVDRQLYGKLRKLQDKGHFPDVMPAEAVKVPGFVPMKRQAEVKGSFWSAIDIADMIAWLKTYIERYEATLGQHDEKTEDKEREKFDKELSAFIRGHDLPNTDPFNLISILQKSEVDA